MMQVIEDGVVPERPRLPFRQFPMYNLAATVTQHAL